MKIEIRDLLLKNIEIIKKNKLKISTAESITGGKFSHYLSFFPDSSSFFYFGITTYSNQSKKEILGVKKDTLDLHGSISKQTAKEMIDNLFRLTKSDICISFTGNSGPTLWEGKKRGLVYIGIKVTSINFEDVFEFNSKEIERPEIIDDVILFTLKKLNNLLRKIK